VPLSQSALVSWVGSRLSGRLPHLQSAQESGRHRPASTGRPAGIKSRATRSGAFSRRSICCP